MDDHIEVKSITNASHGWWAKFINDDDDGVGEWFSPVSCWALCEVKYSKGEDWFSMILPVISTGSSMQPVHPEFNYCEVLFIPEGDFIRRNDQDHFEWVLLNGKNSENNG